MKKLLVVFAILAAVAVGLLVFTSRSGTMSLPTTASSGDVAFLEKKSKEFLEDIQYKDFKKAASYHNREDRKKVDIPNLIERMFAVKPEFLEIMRYEILKTTLDSSGTRCRVKTKTVVKILNTSEIKEPEIILYWFKDPSEGWIMELESSLH
jgi:hypothetical protein